MAILVVADHDNFNLKTTTFNAMGAAKSIAEQGGGDIDIFIAGNECSTVAKSAGEVPGVNKVWVLDKSFCQGQTAENIAPIIARLAKSYTHVLGTSSSSNKNILPRVAALLGVAQLSQIISVEGVDTFKRPIYAGNVIATVKSLDEIKVMTVRSTAFDPVEPGGGIASIVPVEGAQESFLSCVIEERNSRSDRPDLLSAKVIISGGLGMGSRENFSLIEKTANKLDAAVGASRAAVDAGFASNTLQVGQTGVIVAPELYIAVGISGAVQHLAGMKDSRVIVAINKDPEAPIFQVADYGLVGDLFEVLPELERQL
jgi:electron transfer flavoprotein alpha subunit